MQDTNNGSHRVWRHQEHNIMAYGNDIHIVGNLVADPDIKATQSGTMICKFSLARTVKRGENEISQYFDFTAFGELGENIAASLHKGDRMYASGYAEFSTWQTDGVKRSKVAFVADDAGPSLRWAVAEVNKKPRVVESTEAPTTSTPVAAEAAVLV